MKKFLSFALFLLILSSCGQKKSPATFEKMNVKITDEWGRTYALQMDKDGNTVTNSDDKMTEPKSYNYVINEQILDSIFNVTGGIDFSKIDTGYIDSCKECTSYHLAVTQNGKTYTTHVKNINKNPKITMLDKLVNLLYNVVRTTDMDPETLKRKDK